MNEWNHQCKAAGRLLLVPHGEQCDRCGMDCPGLSSPAWCDRENGCFCEFRNVVCSNYCLQPPSCGGEGGKENDPTDGDSVGYKVAMCVLQSELYHHLDDDERADCDELIRRGQASAAKRVPTHPRNGPPWSHSYPLSWLAFADALAAAPTQQPPSGSDGGKENA